MIETQIEPFENKYPLLNVAALKHLILQDEPFLAISPRYVNDGHGGGNFKDVNKGVVIVNEEKVKILGFLQADCRLSMSLDAKSFYGDVSGDRARLRRRLEAAEAGVRSNSALR